MARYKPARADLRVALPERGMLMPPGGIEVPDTTYYRALIRDGDIVPADQIVPDFAGMTGDVDPDAGGMPAGGVPNNPNPDGSGEPTGKRGRKG